MRPFTIRENNRRRALQVTLKNPDGTAVDLTSADSVKFTMMRAGDKYRKLEEKAATIVSAAAGTVKYAWADGDTETPGEYLAYFRVYWDAADDTDIEDFPNGEEEFIPIYITHD